MIYSKIDIKGSYKELGRIACDAEGEKIPNAEEYFWRMNKGEIIQNTPIFDHFYLKSFDEKQYWEWKLCDAHNFIGQGSQIRGWLVSQKLKLLLEKFHLSKPHCFYPSKLLYKGKRIDYYIFQLGGISFRQPLANYINFSVSMFFNPNEEIYFSVNNEQELLERQEDILTNSGYRQINIPIKKLGLKYHLDFFPMQSFLGHTLISERLKTAIEDNGIEGFEFSELDYEVVVEK